MRFQVVGISLNIHAEPLIDFYYHGSFPDVLANSLNFFASFLALNICHINSTKYPILKIRAIGANTKTKTTVSAYRINPSSNIPIPLPTFPTYMCPIPGKPNIPPRKAIRADIQELL